MDLLAIVLWAGAVGGVSAVVFAIVVPPRRQAWLIVAAVLFVPIGILGILSIGVLFLGAALACAVAAVLSGRKPPEMPASRGS